MVTYFFKVNKDFKFYKEIVYCSIDKSVTIKSF